MALVYFGGKEATLTKLLSLSSLLCEPTPKAWARGVFIPYNKNDVL
jgi:hypothetical protein